jgi:hypothetical protein
MTTVVRTSPPSFPAVSSAQLREWLRLDPDVDQATLDLLLGAAVDHIAGLTGLYVVSAEYAVSFAATGCYSLPISNITQTEAGAVVGGNLEIEVEAVPLVVSISAGWTTEEAIPVALRHAIAIYVGAAYDSRHDISEATFATIKRLCAPFIRVAL